VSLDRVYGYSIEKHPDLLILISFSNLMVYSLTYSHDSFLVAIRSYIEYVKLINTPCRGTLNVSCIVVCDPNDL